MIERLVCIGDNGNVMIYAHNEGDQQFIGLVKSLESIEIIGNSWYLHLPDGQTLWAERIEKMP